MMLRKEKRTVLEEELTKPFAYLFLFSQVRHVITSHELLPKFKKILSKCPNVTHITYLCDQLKPTDLTGYKEGIIFNSFEELIRKGKGNECSGQ